LLSKYNINIENCSFLHVFAFQFFIYFSGGGQLTPFVPMCGRPCPDVFATASPNRTRKLLLKRRTNPENRGHVPRRGIQSSRSVTSHKLSSDSTVVSRLTKRNGRRGSRSIAPTSSAPIYLCATTSCILHALNTQPSASHESLLLSIAFLFSDGVVTSAKILTAVRVESLAYRCTACPCTSALYHQSNLLRSSPPPPPHCDVSSCA